MPRSVCALAALLLTLMIAPVAQAEKNLVRPPGTTRYAAMVSRLQALRDYDHAHAGRMTLSSLGRSVQGRTLWLVTLSAPRATGDGETIGGEGATSPTPPSLTGKGTGRLGSSRAGEPKRIFYLCRQHGHEPASTEGALAFINRLVKAEEDTPLAGYLKSATVYIVPMANPDGSENFRRHNARGVDLNRDWLRRTQPETRALYSAVLLLHPDLMTDQHELYPNDTRPDFTEAASAGSGASAAVVTTCDDAQGVVQGAMLAEGFPIITHWVTDTHPARLAHRYASIVAGVPTVLFETNRLNGSGRSVAARAAVHAQFMLTVLRDVSGNRDALVAEAADWQAAHPRETQVLASRHQLTPRAAAPAAMPPAGTPPEQTPEQGTE